MTGLFHMPKVLPNIKFLISNLIQRRCSHAMVRAKIVFLEPATAFKILRDRESDVKGCTFSWLGFK